jgi:Protein of unknown function (DUF3800)
MQYLFADEAGCFTFNKQVNVSRYFIICTVSMPTLDVALELTNLRHDLLRDGSKLSDCFHATTDNQAVRDEVYKAILKHEFRIQATICEKSKAQPQVRNSKSRFYKVPWYFHLKHGLSKHVDPDELLVVTAASIGSKKERATFINGIDDVVGQNVTNANYLVDFRPCVADPCLQVADYCAWAIQRLWERQDSRSYDLIKERITYEYELWKHGTIHYY